MHTRTRSARWHDLPIAKRSWELGVRGFGLSPFFANPNSGSYLERPIDNLGLTEANLQQMEAWLDEVNGMFLAAGLSGCGKTTTVYALLHELRFADRIVVSIANPIEREVPGIAHVRLDEKHPLSFEEGVKAMLRSFMSRFEKSHRISFRLAPPHGTWRPRAVVCAS